MYSILPLSTLPGGLASKPITVRAVTLLPEPDSPTMPKAEPWETLKER